MNVGEGRASLLLQLHVSDPDFLVFYIPYNKYSITRVSFFFSFFFFVALDVYLEMKSIRIVQNLACAGYFIAYKHFYDSL